MSHHRALMLLTSLALGTGLGACSQSASSPTELDLAALDSPSKSIGSVADQSRGGGNDDDDGTAGDNSGRGRGGDNATDNRGRGRGRGGRGNRPQEPRPDQPRGGQQFEGTVLAVNGQTITLSTGTRVIVDGQTQWVARGDLRSLAALAGSVAANDRPRVEGRGTRQADGAILAQTIKAEVDN
jgi:hypothetical protein